jgi:isopentenyl-diphosphate delta-isomerase
MLIDTVDKCDQVVGTIEKSAALRAGVNFRVVHVFVFNEDDLLLIQQIPGGKRHAGLWGSSVAGYVYSGETYEAAARRRLAQELGIDTPEHTIPAVAFPFSP